MAVTRTGRLCLAAGLWAGALTGASAGPLPPSASSVPATEQIALFKEALRHDVTGGPAEVAQAFQLYKRAAEAGLPEAQFNVAVMLDSGRGVAADLPQAAIWYARAAANGNRRAAYNLGQLYARGQGVPRNVDLARAWFVASNLPAARSRLATVRRRATTTGTLSAPTLIAPGPWKTSGPQPAAVELVWTSGQQPEPVRYFVELRAIDAAGSRELFSSFVETSSLKVTLPDTAAALAWRVLAVARKEGRYAASDWAYLRTGPD